jgi:hypothetical protein
MKKIFPKIIKSQFIFFVSVLIFVFLFLSKQVNPAYIDYGDGSYLYELKLIESGKRLYIDFFAPQPPFFYFFGYLIYSINHSIIFIRFLFLILNLLSLYLFYLIIRKIFQNYLIALLSTITTFIFTISIFWWPTFTGEVFLRFFIFLLLYLELLKENSKKLIYLKSLLLVIIFFSKYTSLFFIFFYLFFLFVNNKKIFQKTLIYSLINFLLINLVFIIFFGLDIYSQTIIVRKILPFKPTILSVSSTIYFLLKFIPFYMLNLIISSWFFIKKDYKKSFIFFLPLTWLPNLYFNFIEGTYLYVFYPLEPFITTGFYYLLLYRKKLTINFSCLVRLISYFSVFWGILVIIYQLQIFPDYYSLRSNMYDIKTSEKIVEILKKNNERFVIAPPFFLFVANKQSYPNFHDPFFFLYYLKRSDSNFKLSHFEELRKKLLVEKPNQLFVDWRIKTILFDLDRNYLKHYQLTNTFNFLINPSETIEVFEKIND